jgi:peroxiredoxin
MKRGMNMPALSIGEKAPLFVIPDVNGVEFSLSEYAGKKNVVLVFLRYLGCPICQMTLADLKNEYGRFTAKDAEVVAFVQSPPETIRKSGDASAFPFRLIPDEDERIYKLYRVGVTNIFGLVNPNVLRQGLKAMLKGHRQGKKEGNTFQVPGEFIIDKNGVLRLARTGKDAGDNMPVDELLSHL